MRLVTYRAAGGLRAGVLVGEQVVDVAEAAGAAGLTLDTPVASARPVLELDEPARAALASAAERLASSGQAAGDVSGLELGPPLPDPDKIIGIGLNYRAHADEMAMDAPQAPTLFAKFRNALAGTGSPIELPANSAEVDFEGELAVVVGRRCKDVPAHSALDYVGGYMALNDVSARDLQMRTSQWTAGKVADSFAPCGPALVLADEVPDPGALAITTRLNGTTVQAASTAQLIFGIPEVLSFLSSLMTLEPGDIVATGTPAGVGYTREPPLFLKPGDVIEVEIEGLGILSNPVTSALPLEVV
jgi:2-keto-4-pentenoate hydratase/2-oxohepta-3-ene-1,7-dioic acid hydratase in catechol pathway